ncbi:MAG: sec-independent translocase [Actinomycetota bacterium]
MTRDYPERVFGLDFEKLLVIGIIAVIILGPQRLPKYAAQLGRLVRSLRAMANDARDRLRDEMGPEFDDVDWQKLDPRQYDPRRIIRDALTDAGDDSAPVVRPAVKPSSRMAPGLAAPYDNEAT